MSLLLVAMASLGCMGQARRARMPMSGSTHEKWLAANVGLQDEGYATPLKAQEAMDVFAKFLLALDPTVSFNFSDLSKGFKAASRGTGRRSTPVASLPSSLAMAASCIGPTCLGFWKNGYAVSYAYGGAMAAGAWLMLPHTTGLAAAHAAAFIFYGIRLVIFLLYRELALPESVHQMVNRPSSFLDRLKRAPVLLGCAFLYFCMLAPLRVTASIGAELTGPAAATVLVMHLGFALAALGDLVKSAVKAIKGPDTLVTAFPYNVLRHPNYTGEFIGWTASFFVALIAAASSGVLVSRLGWLVVSAIGTFGIQFVLAGACASLEKKQAAKWSGSPEYEDWLTRTWSGPAVRMANESMANEST